MLNLPEETVALQDLTRRLVREYQMPLETRMLRGEKLLAADYLPGTQAAREAGLWGLALPEEYGGAHLSTVDQMAIVEENFRCLAPLRFGGAALSPLFNGTPGQKEKFLFPVLEGRMKYAFAQTEPGGGGDPGGAIRTQARRQGAGWVINGTKVFISHVAEADYIFVVAVTDSELRQRGGISMFAVERGNPGLKIAREIPVLGGMIVHELFFDDCYVPDEDLIGGEGGGFRNAQIALSVARFAVGARALGIAQRAYEMMVGYARQRHTFGKPLAERQAVQGMIVDSWMEIHQARLALYNAAQRNDRGYDTRVEAGMIKMLGTEVVGRVLDRAIQVHGAAGVSLDNPLAHWYDSQRLARIYEGPTEVHKYHVLARHLLAA
ncbi:acyl-CoA dehydrogenase [Verticiella sediminum]|uniref:Acyl-CoA dehydrogenase n=1 Tax=Verticiella sediminum TaxID=1247510 RepID=A0A556B264_9BURK|nr:acyl-CoA dehydrogenase family protein [Verticiella sediminum]TSH99254.1 acyl-CoA dehydrogenase [Verticiella sediminum]